jgi:rhodanese-related sulfurtransferase
MVTLLRSTLREVGILAIAAVIATIGYANVRPALARWYQNAFGPRKAATTELVTGGVISLKGFSIPASDLSLILIVSPSCRYCIASESFHRSLSEQARKRNLPLYLAVPSRSEAKDYINSSGIVGQVLDWSDLNFHVDGTPTLVMMDSEHVARAILVGKLPEGSESAVKDILDSPERLKTAQSLDGRARLTQTEAAALRANKNALLLDVREREEYEIGHSEGAVNIPIVEFPVRAPFELDRTRLLVVDCSQVPTGRCDLAAKFISGAGFRAAELSEGYTLGTCQATNTSD